MQYRNLVEALKQLPPWMPAFETAVVSFFGLALCWWAEPSDPYFVLAVYPWPIIAPVLVALRYGFFYGTISVAIIDISLVIAIQQQWVDYSTIPYSYLVGMALTTMLVGEFRDFGQRQLEVLRQSNLYRQVRLDEFTRNYHLLKVSHDRLEQQLAGHGQSLREALRLLQRRFSHKLSETINTKQGRQILELLSQYTYLQAVALVNVVNNKVVPKSIAELGGVYEVEPKDPLVVQAIKERRLMAVPVNKDGQLEPFDSQYIVAAPIIDSENNLYGLVVVKRMPFFALTSHTLTLLAVLVGRIADFINYSKYHDNAEDEEQQWFAVNLIRAALDAEQVQVPSSLLLIRFNSDETAERVTALIKDIQRGLDLVIRCHKEKSNEQLILFPLTDELGLAGYKLRLAQVVRERLGKDLDSMDMELRQHSISNRSELALFLKLEGIDGWQMARHTGNLS